MQKLEVCILGCSSATPTSNRNPTAQIVTIAGRYFLIDCGEGTQMQIRKYKIKLQRIEAIFISHLHGDHFFGLIGLLSSMHLLGRKEPMTIYCPQGLQEIIELQNKYSESRFNFDMVFKVIPPKENAVLFEDEKLSVESIILYHRVPCTGFYFKEKAKAKQINKSVVQSYGIPTSEFNRIKLGDAFTTKDGAVIPHEALTIAPPLYSYAYCSDTIFDARVIEQVKGATVLYHEATFMHELIERAKETYHTTALQAAQVARDAQVQHLIIGHFSARYHDLQPLLQEAQSQFPNTVLAVEGKTYTIPFSVQ